MSLRVAVLGAGLAGMIAAADLLCSNGDGDDLSVELYDVAPHPGGRLTSWDVPGFDSKLDNGQHILTGSCHSSIQLFQSLDEDALFSTGLPALLTEAGRVKKFFTLPLPRPLHLLPLFLGYGQGFFATLRGGLQILSLRSQASSDCDTLAEWLQKNQPQVLIQRFWRPFVVSVFNRSPEAVEFEHFRSWARETIFSDRDCLEVYSFTKPLSRLSELLAERLQQRGGLFKMNSHVTEVDLKTGAITVDRSANGTADIFVFALPPDQTARLLQKNVADNTEYLDHFTASPILTVHLLFDRELELPRFISLPDSEYDWYINPAAGPGRLVQFMVSNAASQIDMPDSKLLNECRRLLAQLSGDSPPRIVCHQIFRNRRATYHLPPNNFSPGKNFWRPCENVVLAGDWTYPQWPATIEAAIRSGHRAAREVKKIIAPE